MFCFAYVRFFLQPQLQPTTKPDPSRTKFMITGADTTMFMFDASTPQLNTLVYITSEKKKKKEGGEERGKGEAIEGGEKKKKWRF